MTETKIAADIVEGDKFRDLRGRHLIATANAGPAPFGNGVVISYDGIRSSSGVVGTLHLNADQPLLIVK